MSRDEVLEYVQTFTEVRSDWGFDDRTVWLSHQTTHTCELTNLSRATTSARVGHHVNRVERILFNLLAIFVSDDIGLQVVHHLLSQQLVRT